MNARTLKHAYAFLNTQRSRGIHFLYAFLIRPKSGNEDAQRREYILNVILVATILLTLWCTGSIVNMMDYLGPNYHGVPLVAFAVLDVFFIGLLIISRLGHPRLASYIMIGFYYAVITATMLQWGIELPLAAMGFVLVIAFSSILLSTRLGIIITAAIAVTVISIGYAQVHGIIHPSLDWKIVPIRLNDAFELAVIFGVIMTVSWLSNREIETSLARARASEHALTLERDNLELRVEERTRELKEAQLEKTAHLYRMAEFGRLSSGLFHDLMNPLQGVIAAVHDWHDTPDHRHIADVRSALERAMHASQRMGNFISTVRRQMNPREFETQFSLTKELQEAVDVVRFKARENRVIINKKATKELVTFGNPLKFHQIALNLLVNAIDACEGHGDAEPRVIHAKISKFNGMAQMKITDRGAGIPPELIGRIFDPFFTTKSSHKGMGLGLSTTKAIVEKDFSGTITVTSTLGHGTTFTVTVPLHNGPLSS